MIIEFNGLPGTGKTSVCNALAERVRGARPVTFRRFVNESRLKRYISYILDGSVILYKLAARFSNSVCRDAAETEKDTVKKNRKLAYVPVMYYHSYMNFYRANRDDCEVMLIDQGIIQGLISIAHDREIVDTSTLDPILIFLKNKGVKFTCIDCVSNVEISDKRIEERSVAGASRLDCCDTEERKRILYIQKKNFDTVRGRVKAIMGITSLSIDTTTRTADDNAAYIDEELGITELK